MEPTTNGSCLCGGVRYSVLGPLRDVWQCHCSRCKKTSGNFVAASGALLKDIRFRADETLTWYRPDDDPNVSYAFCRRCGASLFWRVVDQGDVDQHVSVMAGALDDAHGLRTTAVWFADHADEHTPLDPSIDHLDSSDL
jgi:hypothetical protein